MHKPGKCRSKERPSFRRLSFEALESRILLATVDTVAGMDYIGPGRGELQFLVPPRAVSS